MRRSLLVAAAIAVLFAPAALHAQRPVSIGIAGGASIPSGDLRDGVDVGWHALATIAVSTLMQRLSPMPISRRARQRSTSRIVCR